VLLHEECLATYFLFFMNAIYKRLYKILMLKFNRWVKNSVNRHMMGNEGNQTVIIFFIDG
jgi:hypothetical protein